MTFPISIIFNKNYKKNVFENEIDIGLYEWEQKIDVGLYRRIMTGFWCGQGQ